MWVSGVVFYVLVLVCTASANIVPDSVPKNVTINKCCRIDEHLTKSPSNFTCVNRQENWIFRIYENGAKVRNTLPKYFLLKESQRPACVSLRHIFNNDYILLPNGSLFAPSLHSLNNNTFFHPRQYCLDYTAALVCVDPTNKTEVRKCCFEGQAFSQKTKGCVNATKGLEHLFGEDLALTFGFPKCRQDNHGVVGKIHRPELLVNGSLWLNTSGKLLDSGGFCLEHIVDDPGRLERNNFICIV